MLVGVGRRDLASKRKNNGANVRRELSKILARKRLTLEAYFRVAADDYAFDVSDTSLSFSLGVYTRGGELPRYVMQAVYADRLAPPVRHYATSRDLRDARHV